MAIWACLGSKYSQVRILLPGPGRFGIWEFGFGICFARQFQNPKSQIRNSYARVAQLGRGACLRNKLMKVRILPRASLILDFGFSILDCRNRTGELRVAFLQSKIQNLKSKIHLAGIAKRRRRRTADPQSIGSNPIARSKPDAWRMPTRLHSSFGRTLVLLSKRSPVRLRLMSLHFLSPFFPHRANADVDYMVRAPASYRRRSSVRFRPP